MTTKNITVPDIGGAADVDVIEVLVKPGDVIKKETSLVTLESDKATMEVPSSDEGVVKEIKIKPGDKVSQGSVILVLEVSGETTASAITEKKPTATAGAGEAMLAGERLEAGRRQNARDGVLGASSQHSSPASAGVVGTHDIHASPIVRKIAREFDINLAQVPATGPKSRISKEDIITYVKTRLAQAATGGGGAGLPTAPVVDFAKFGSVTTQPLSRLKKLSGKNLHRNWLLVPHVTQFAEADITELEMFRSVQKGALEKQGIKLTPLVFIMKAVAASLKAFPQFNASLDASGENLVLKNYFHIGVAVDTPEGLVVPVIRDVDKKGLNVLAKELSVVSEKARNKQLTPNDMQGGCFSISSLGGIGGTAFTPIVNVPEVAILGVSKAAHKPVYQNGQFVPRLMLPLSLSYDHRVIDGADGARFVTHLSTMLSDIRDLLL